MLQKVIYLILFCICSISSIPLVAETEAQTQLENIQSSPFPITEKKEDQKPLAPSFQALFAKTMILVFFLLALATGGLILLKKTQSRFFKPQNQGDIAILEKRSLSPKTQLFLLTVKGKDLILVESAHTVTITPVHADIEKKEQT